MPAELQGVGVSPGVVVGPVAVAGGEIPVPADATTAADPAAEARAATEALEAVARDLEARGRAAGGEAQGVLEAQAMMARDPGLTDQVEQHTRGGRPAARAVYEAFGLYRKLLGGAGAEGVGLFRTEFLFLDRADPPPVDEQAAAYRSVLEAFPGGKVVIRTLDAGADKPLAFLDLGDEPNPALGVRGLRAVRRRPELLTASSTPSRRRPPAAPRRCGSWPRWWRPPRRRAGSAPSSAAGWWHGPGS
jgi:phosphoenolpyruvate-protein kinase (PTS system EI component)